MRSIVAGLLGCLLGYFAYGLSSAYCETGQFAPRLPSPAPKSLGFALLMGVLCALMAHFADIAFSAPVCLLLGMLSLIDLRCGLLPNILILLMLLIALLRAVLLGLWESSLYGLLAGGGFYALAYLLGRLLLKKEAMGLGDVKLMAVCGFWLGWERTLFALLIAPVAALLVLLALMLAKRFRRDAFFPFGPFIVFASLLCQLIAGDWFVLYIAYLGF